MFSTAVDHILQSLQMPQISVEIEEIDDSLARFKEFVVEYNSDHAGSPVLDQVMNASTLNEIEQYLRANFDYCDDCLLNMYRKFAASGN